MKEKSRAMIDQIRKLGAEGHSIKKICQALGVSKNTVRRYLRMKADALESVSSVEGQNVLAFDWKAAVTERKLGRPVKRIFEEMTPDMSYAHFAKLIRKSVIHFPKVAMRLEHKPGETAQVDYGDGLFLTDPGTGKQTKTQFFCGVLPFSSLVFGEFTASQKIPDFIRSHDRMWVYFGGVSQYVVLDNLKSGVTKAHRYDPDLNPTYCDYANHAGFAALPARVRTPRDKACVEATIGVIQRDFFDRFRHQKFYSLDDLNRCFRLYVDDLNLREMADYGCSRRNRFQAESMLLKPLPENVYELYEWKQAKVHPDSCIELFKSVYSVPFQYVHQEVRVKFSDQMVIILDISSHEVIATHARREKFCHSIREEHLPEAKTQLKNFSVVKVQKFADGIGPNTRAYIDWQFGLEEPLRALRRMLGLLRFYETKSPSIGAMEHAARLAMNFQRHNLSYFQSCAKSYSAAAGGLHLVTAPERKTSQIHVSKPLGE